MLKSWSELPEKMRNDEVKKYYKILYDLYHVNYTYDDIYKSVKNNKPISVNEIGER